MKLIYVLVVVGILSACASSKALSPSDMQEVERMETLLQTQNFEFIADRAYPQVSGALQQVSNGGLLGVGNTAGMINLQGNPNFLTIKNDSLKMRLPFYGERRLNGGYGTSGGIEVEGELSSYTMLSDSKKASRIIKFSARENSEMYNITMTVFPSLRADVMVNSSHRSSIRYEGMITAIKEAAVEE